jgi:hypothetical protein
VAEPKIWTVYNLDQVQRFMMNTFVHATPPRVHPAQLLPLLQVLDKVTTIAEKHAAKVRVWLSERGGTSDLWQQFWPVEKELEGWRLRLINYRAVVDGCLPEDDAECTLWSVTAPLFFGFFGGATSKEPPQPSDVMTPFKLANRLGAITDADEVSNIDSLLEDLGRSTGEVTVVIKDATVGTVRALGEAAGKVVGAAAGGIKAGLLSDAGGVALLGVGAFIFWLLVIRKPRAVEAAA